MSNSITFILSRFYSLNLHTPRSLVTAVGVQMYPFLTSTLQRAECSASLPGSFTIVESEVGTHGIRR